MVTRMQMKKEEERIEKKENKTYSSRNAKGASREASRGGQDDRKRAFFLEIAYRAAGKLQGIDQIANRSFAHSRIATNFHL
jgi:hypothetical protein